MPRTLGLLLLALAIAAPAVAGQTAPRLSRAERETLQTIVAEVDRAAASPDTPNVNWQTHVLRTSDGAHYVAFSIDAPGMPRPHAGATIYVRLATRPDPRAGVVAGERSAVMEWLKGMRSDPLVAKKRGGIAFGEMPVFGAAGIAVRGPGQQTSDLALLSMERERARERREAAERERKAALEGTASARLRDAVFPFEDFTVGITPADAAAGHPLQRSVTAGPGDFDLYAAWAAPAAKGTPLVHVAKRRLQLPAASTTDFAVSSIILADAVGTREMPYPPDQQSAHPYAIGPMAIVPASDDTFTNAERLAVVLQVINAQPDETGKPDVSIAFQLFRVTADGERSVGILTPQHYNATTMPAVFDLTRGHPLFAAMAAPLKTLARGQYRLQITATDGHAGRRVSASAAFRIVATPATLLSTAPVAIAVQREEVLAPAVLRESTARLEAADMSPALAAALAAAREGRWVDLLRDDVVAPAEQPARTTLRGLGLLALGDPRMASAMLRQSIQALASPKADPTSASEGGPMSVAHFYLGAARALEANDRDAIASWQAALETGMPPSVVAPLVAGAYIRLGDLAAADQIARPLVVDGVPDGSILRALATIHVAAGREGDAIPLIERHLATHPEDVDAQYLLLHALFAGFVNNRGAGATPEGRTRFQAVAQQYTSGKGRHAGVVAEWLETVR